jgi:hypothetical protein
MPLADENFWAIVREFHAHLPVLNDAGGSGYYYIFPKLEIPNIGSAVPDIGSAVPNIGYAVPNIGNAAPSIGNAAVLTLAMFFANQTDTSRADHLFAPLVSTIQNLTGSSTSYMSYFIPKISLIFQSALMGADKTGSIAVLGSRMISRDFLVTNDGPSKLAKALSSIQQEPGSAFIGHIVAGGQVSRNGDHIDSALNPAWRRTATHLLFSRSWLTNATFAEQKAIQANITNIEVPILKSLEPGQMGAYLNEADANEADFQTSFWGENYGRLYEIKQKWDSNGLFISRRGVGSEDWDDDGLCRTK